MLQGFTWCFSCQISSLSGKNVFVISMYVFSALYLSIQPLGWIKKATSVIWKLSLIWGWDLNQKWWHAKSNFSSVWMINSLLRMHTRLTAVLKALIGVASIKLAAKPYRNGEGTFSVFSSVGFWPCYIYDLFPFCVSTRLIAAWISCSILLTRKDVGSW